MKLTKEWVENELKHSEALENHRPPDEEYAFYCAVRDGDMEYVQKNCTAEVISASNMLQSGSINASCCPSMPARSPPKKSKANVTCAFRFQA